MSMYFTKLFSSITESTVWFEPNETRIVWITMLAMADQNGRVFASVPGLAARARVPVEACRVALVAFLSPDPDSRTKEHEGRRIEELDGGWRMLNHAKYRALKDEESQRERAAEKQKRYRQRKKELPGPLPALPIVTESYPIAEADTEAEEPSVPDNDCLDPSMAVSGLIVQIGLYAPRARIVLDAMAREAFKGGADMGKWVEEMARKWRLLEESRAKLEYAWGAENFFGEGHYKNPNGWPWKEGQSLNGNGHRRIVPVG